METKPLSVLEAWSTVLGDGADLGDGYTGRELWPITAEDGSRYFLKRLGPWRNLPLADEARVLRHLAMLGVPVAEFIPTDRALLYAGEVEDSFVLMPRLANDSFHPDELVTLEATIGGALAELHLALAAYPWPVNSYTENVGEALLGDLMLPPDIATMFAAHRDAMAATLASLPAQHIHGDLTPENVVLRQPGNVSGFIDFDHLPQGPRIWDIGKYLSRRLRMRWRESPHPSGRLDHLPGFLKGYCNVDPLGSAEVAALPAAIVAGNVLEASYYLEISAGTLPRRRMPDHDAVLADTIEAARWHLSHVDTVAHAVTACIG